MKDKKRLYIVTLKIPSVYSSLIVHQNKEFFHASSDMEAIRYVVEQFDHEPIKIEEVTYRKQLPLRTVLSKL